MDKKKIATALKYDSEKQIAPELVAKGKGVVAENIIKVAEEAGVKTYEDELLSQQLYNLSIGDTIPEELYHVVAKVLTFIAQMDQKEHAYK
ncbi:flagellar biogenesis protein [Acidaminobacter sp. JC074]|uniref:EscU/YscU/HrcU family type III secretion system export apparatus switch protein n=1 Tax=Acidaminobacter sp. JC074 TaxID=2530199 RepID=UPI001F0E84C9|nr:EscU/YscU/HrcU family type III secretion system export apparatus switch protein [Acidaminobacter sp. JC074]MCH4888709.1 flagellar biogenesis protein [Acidaminobacter sp. JC074]